MTRGARVISETVVTARNSSATNPRTNPRSPRPAKKAPRLRTAGRAARVGGKLAGRVVSLPLTSGCRLVDCAERLFIAVVLICLLLKLELFISPSLATSVGAAPWFRTGTIHNAVVE